MIHNPCIILIIFGVYVALVNSAKWRAVAITYIEQPGNDETRKQATVAATIDYQSQIDHTAGYIRLRPIREKCGVNFETQLAVFNILWRTIMRKNGSTHEYTNQGTYAKLNPVQLVTITDTVSNAVSTAVCNFEEMSYTPKDKKEGLITIPFSDKKKLTLDKDSKID